MTRIRLLIYGDVTGVGFRAWTAKQAQQLRLTGWVRNASSECVEVVAEGMEKQLEALHTRCRKGPEVSWVEEVKVSWEKGTGEFEDFQIIL